MTCEAVIDESCYLLRRLRGAAVAVLEDVVHKYRDREIDFADACLVHLAGELRIGDILTLDRDFEVYRRGAAKPFRLLIPLA